MPNYQVVGFSRKEVNGVLNSSQVPANRTDYNVLFRAADLPAEMINNALAEATNDPNTPGKASEALQNIALGVAAADPTKGPIDRIPINVVNFDLSTQDIEIWAKFPDVFASGNTPHTWFWGGDGNPNTLNDKFGKLACHDEHTSFYTMDDLTDSTLKDYGTNQVDAIQTGTPGPVVSNIGFAQNYVRTSSEGHTIAGKLGTPIAYTCEIWFQSTNHSNTCDLFSIADNHHIRMSAITEFFYRSGGGWWIINYGVDLRDGNRHHIVFMGASGNQRLYVDGILRATGAQGSPGYDIGTDTTIGKHGTSSTNFFDGDIDNVIFSPEIKNDNYVTTVYNNQKPSSIFITRGTSPEANLLPTVRKPTRKGTFQIGAGDTFVNVAIGATVDMNLSYVKAWARVATGDGPKRYLVASEIFGGNMLQMNVIATGVLIDGGWEVIEYQKDSGVFVNHSFENSTSALITTLFNQTVNPSNTHPIFTPAIDGGGFGFGETFKYSVLSDGTGLLQERNSSNSAYISRQILSHANISVQQFAYSSNLATVNQAITAVNLSKTFAYASASSNDLDGFEQNGRVKLTSSTNVRLEKYQSGNTKTGYIYVVEFLPETDEIVQVLDFDLGASDTDENKLITAVALEFASLWDGNDNYQIFPSDDTNAFGVSENSVFSIELDSSTNIRIRRAGVPSIIARGTIYIISVPIISGIQSALVNGGLIKMGLTSKGLVR